MNDVLDDSRTHRRPDHFSTTDRRPISGVVQQTLRTLPVFERGVHYRGSHGILIQSNRENDLIEDKLSSTHDQSKNESSLNESSPSKNASITDMTESSPGDPWDPVGNPRRGHGALSGVGSETESVKPLIAFLEKFLREKNVTSLVEASCGHWPSGWQQNVSWPLLKYVGVDVSPGVIAEDQALIKTKGQSFFGIESMEFRVGDMTRDELPPADVLLTKDTLIHFPISAVQDFLDKQVSLNPPKYKYVIYVNDKPTNHTNPDCPPAMPNPGFC